MDHDPFAPWIGGTEHQHDTIDLARARRMHALLDRPPEELHDGTPLPAGYHWLYCIPITLRSRLGPDGHPRRGGFLPPLPGTRRMWAGGSLRFLQPLRIGDTVERRSTIATIEEKNGRAGRFHVVRLTHHITTPDGIAIEEQQHLVYLPVATPPGKGRGVRLAGPTDWQDTFVTDEVVLFHFSALTLNGHRIHYDQPYAREEGYPALLVHAPLTALLLLDAARRNGCPCGTFEYRAVAPIFCRDTITLAGAAQPDGSARLWALRGDGDVALEATATG